MELCDSSRGTEFLKLLILICLKYSKELPQILTEVGQKDPKLCPRKKRAPKTSKQITRYNYHKNESKLSVR